MYKFLMPLIIYCCCADGMRVSMNPSDDRIPSPENYGINETIHNELFKAMAMNDIDTFRHRIEGNAWLLETRDSLQSTLLHIACMRQQTNFVKLLVDLGADVLSRDCFNSTPLHNAAYAGSLDIVKYLVDHGSTIDKVDCFNNTPLYFACDAGNMDVIRYLIQQGANIHHTDDFGRTPIQAAFESGDISVVKYFVKDLHIDMATKMSKGRSPLHLAALHGHTDVIIYLIKKGADPLALDDQGKKPFDLATSDDIRNILLQMHNH